MRKLKKIEDIRQAIADGHMTVEVKGEPRSNWTPISLVLHHIHKRCKCGKIWHIPGETIFIRKARRTPTSNGTAETSLFPLDPKLPPPNLPRHIHMVDAHCSICPACFHETAPAPTPPGLDLRIIGGNLASSPTPPPSVPTPLTSTMSSDNWE